MRVPAAATKPRTAKFTSYPAPTGGWVANRNLAKPNQYGTQPGASVLENWFPLATSVVLRRGSELYTTLGDGSVSVASLFSYVNGTNKKMFGATTANIYDITTSTATSVLASQTSGLWSVIQFETSGGVFLRGVNGSDTPFVFDGTTWGTTPAITFTDGTLATDLNYVWGSKNRMWFVKKNSLTAYYLPVDSIGGAANAFPLGAMFTRGGSLLFGASWSIETMGSGLIEHCVFVSTEGEAAVYSGTDPSTATDWTLVGVYRIGRPLGPKAWIRAGGDLVIATDVGFVPLSQAMQRDYSALSPSAVSYPIEDAWNDAVSERSGSNWNCEVWPTSQMVVVAPPTVSGTSPEIFAANARTGAWAKFTGWDATCLCVYDTRLFFGSTGGKVIEANVSGFDQNAPYTGTYIPLFDDLRAPGSLKIARVARAVLREGIPINEKLTVNVDFDTSTPAVPDATPVSSVSAWGTGIWGQSVWGASPSLSTQNNWKSVGTSGYTLAPCVQVTSGNTVPLDTQLVRVDLTYDECAPRT